MGELREWWTETNRGIGWLGKAVLLSTSVSVPGLVRYLADKTEAVPIYQALTTTLPLTAAAAIIAYRGYRKLSLSLGFIAAAVVGTAAATAVLGIAGGGGVREAFVHVRTAPSECFDVQGFSTCLPGATTYDTPQSLPEVLVRLATVYWHLWGFWGIFTAIAVGWFLGWFLARQVVGAIARRRAPQTTPASSSPQPESTGPAVETECLRCDAPLAPMDRFCSACGHARPIT
jgi:hypothetical protein